MHMSLCDAGMDEEMHDQASAASSQWRYIARPATEENFILPVRVNRRAARHDRPTTNERETQPARHTSSIRLARTVGHARFMLDYSARLAPRRVLALVQTAFPRLRTYRRGRVG
jgi:hypothetical protein